LFIFDGGARFGQLFAYTSDVEFYYDGVDGVFFLLNCHLVFYNRSSSGQHMSATHSCRCEPTMCCSVSRSSPLVFPFLLTLPSEIYFPKESCLLMWPNNIRMLRLYRLVEALYPSHRIVACFEVAFRCQQSCDSPSAQHTMGC